MHKSKDATLCRKFLKGSKVCKDKLVVPLHPKKEEESHLLSRECPVYGDLVHLVTNREDDQQLTTLFTSILDSRGRLEEQEESRQPMVAGIATDLASPTPGQASIPHTVNL